MPEVPSRSPEAGRRSLLKVPKSRDELRISPSTNHSRDSTISGYESGSSRRIVSTRPDSVLMKNWDDWLSPSTNHSRDSVWSGESGSSRRIVVRRPDGLSGISTVDSVEKESRRCGILESLRNLDINDSFQENKPRLIHKVTAYDLYRSDDDVTDSSSVNNVLDPQEFDIGEEPESCRSLLTSPSLEEHHRTNSFSDPSVIHTSASDEQWANFKLLGRVGLGDISVSKPARTLIRRDIRVLTKALKQVMALRDADTKPLDTTFEVRTGTVLDEVKVTLDVPASKAEYKRDPKSIVLDEKIESQLRDYVTVISCMYRDNGFHNFEHASQVLKSANAILSFISISEGNDSLDIGGGSGIITDPWTHFALIFSALVHDVDHAGVPNCQLIKERSIIAGSYKDKSVAEQNSIDIAWNLLMEPCYRELREALFMTPEEVSRFRRLVVIFVMATDIADKELANLREDRAQKAFTCAHPSDDIISRKATYVMETIMQVADVSHTMQPFDTFKKWNHMLYREMYTAYENGRAEEDPTETWFRGDLGFFNFYIIPLARKLLDCGVFDLSKAKNLLENAIENRNKWKKHGEKIVEEYVAERLGGPPLPPRPSRRASMDSTGSTGSFFSDMNHSWQASPYEGRRRSKKINSKGTKKKNKQDDMDLPSCLPLNDSFHSERPARNTSRKAAKSLLKASKLKAQRRERARSLDEVWTDNDRSALSSHPTKIVLNIDNPGNAGCAADEATTEEIVLPTRLKRTKKPRSKSIGLGVDSFEKQEFAERVRLANEAKEANGSKRISNPREPTRKPRS
eukprot:scaffold26570_cov147-Cylindrotheca_fusiformis.AAC.1